MLGHWIPGIKCMAWSQGWYEGNPKVLEKYILEMILIIGVTLVHYVLALLVELKIDAP